MAESYFNLPPAAALPPADMPGRHAVTLAEVSGDITALAKHALGAGFIPQSGPRHELPKPQRIGWFAWQWLVSDAAADRTVAQGRAWTRERAFKRQHKAYHRELDRIGRVNDDHVLALAEDAERYGTGCE
jgi:hypothetical protein